MSTQHGWFEKSEKDIVNHIVAAGRGVSHSEALAEMQRRQILAIREFSRASSRQALVMIWLTVAILVLTVVMIATAL